MADDKDPRIITPLPQSMVVAIDDYRFENRLPSRAEAIRQLLELGLASGLGVWTVGILRGRHFTRLPDSPSFDAASDAEAWAKTFLEANPTAIDRGLESLTWRRSAIEK